MSSSSAESEVPAAEVSRPTGGRNAGLAVAVRLWVPLLAALAALSVVALMAWWQGPPAPAFQDEFAYLLAAETFASGRLTNPVPQAMASLETFQVLSAPTYSAKYPPAQGMALALGLLIAGNPLLGVWLSFAAAAAAVVWMLAGWLPLRWASLGGLLMVVQLGINNYWTQSYWGGCVATAGGALVLGALPRLRVTAAPAAAALLAVGLVLLANSRPLEGLVVAAVAAAFLLLDRPARRVWSAPRGRLRVLVPLVVIGALGGAAMAQHNRAVTGSVLTFPYSVYEQAHNPFPLFLWGEVRELEAPQHRAFHELYDVWLRATFERQQTFTGWLSFKIDRLYDAGALLLGPLLALALLGGALSPRRAAKGVAAAMLLAVLVVLMCTVSFRPQYMAPAFGSLWLLVMLGLETLSERAAKAVPALARQEHRFWLVAASLLMTSAALRLVYVDPRVDIAARRTASQQRVELTADLHRQGGRHLVFVDARPPYSPHDEWVYNAPDPTTAPIVWARFLDEQRNRKAIAAYPGRALWRVELGVGAVENIGLYRYDEPSDWR